MRTNDTLPLPTDFSAKRIRRFLFSRGNGYYRDVTKAARRRDRRAAKRIYLYEDGDAYMPSPVRRCTSWEVA